MGIPYNKVMVGFLIFSLILILSWTAFSQSPHPTSAKEVESLKVIARKLNITAWDFSEDPCSQKSGWTNSNVGILSCGGCDNTTCYVVSLYLRSSSFSGTIPADIGNFSELQTLFMQKNLFSGSIPPEFGQLSKLVTLDLSMNQLSGEIPVEIANLKNLRYLNIGSNNFSGASFPLVLTKLSSLLELQIDHSQFGGLIPPEIGNLTDLVKLHMFGNQFSGSVPDTFGRLGKLTLLRMYGNDIESLPSSFWNMTNLTELNLGDFSLYTGIPTDIQKMQKLRYLSLRNCHFSGSIPDEIGMLYNLSFLDLSFNNLMGVIPESLSNLTSLQYLYLSENDLIGSLPSELGVRTDLNFLDVSNNKLSGSLPPWVNKSGLSINLSWNLFNTTVSSRSIVSLAFNCPNPSMQCNGASPVTNRGFGINCGGKHFTMEGINYEADTVNLQDVGFYVSPTGTWAVSSGGHVPGGDIFNSIVQSSSDILPLSTSNTLYLSARASSSSLKYYGLNMVNGNYAIHLHFAEIDIRSNGWQRNGKRVFDVFIQGVRVLTDYEIMLDTNGSFIPIVKTFNTEVRENYLVIHFFWTGKGTCCIPLRYTYGPLISAIRVSSGSGSRGTSVYKRNIAIAVPLVFASVGVLIFILFMLFQRRKHNTAYTNFEGRESSESNRAINVRTPIFTFRDLEKATDNFSSRNKLGQGAFASVYKGVLNDGRVVAVKVLVTKQKGSTDFMSEIDTLLAVQHRNLVKLYGCCMDENNHILVFEHLPNNSLSEALFGSKLVLDWLTRFKICIGIARGLSYLHHECRTKIIHRDIKASNILLDKDMQPKIGDFGLAKLIGDEETHVITRVAGTHGYMAPEYMYSGQLTEKADIYSFGILIVELVSGQKSMDNNLSDDQSHLLELTWQLYEDNVPLNLVDKRLSKDFNKEEALRLIEITLLCTQAIASTRPKMSDVVLMLTGKLKFKVNLSRPSYLADLKQSLSKKNEANATLSN